MEMQRDHQSDKRRRKTINHPVLVRSVKPGQVMSATYDKDNHHTSRSIWKAA